MVWVFFLLLLGLAGVCAALLVTSVRLRKTLQAASRAGETAVRNSERRACAAEEEKNRIAAILESMMEGVVVVDTREKVVLTNSVMARALGLAKEELEELYFWEVFRDSEINEVIRQALSDRVSAKREHSLLLSNAVFQIQVSPAFAGSEFLGVVLVFYDVTQLRRLERVRADFVANVSHELKTPLTSILGFVETLKEGAADDAEKRASFLQIIEEHSKKLHRLIEDLLFLSEVESAGEPLKKEAVDLDDLCRRLLRFFERPIRDRGITVKCDLPHRPFWVAAEPKTFEQALGNLIDNAVKYNREGGRLEIAARQEPGRVEVKVGDTGIGIPESDLQRIFERFYRVEKGRSRETGGSGLGLAIAKHIVERHGGSIVVRSALQKGSVFTVSLPVH